jgi:hypothetical protein
MKLLRISKVDQQPNFPFRASTLYKWKHTAKFPQLFAKVGGALFIDLDELERIAERGRGAR